MGDWSINLLNWAFAIWGEKLGEIWTLVAMSPQAFKGGAVWSVIVRINGGLQAFGYGLLILFFAMSVFKSTANFQDLRRPEQALRFFIRFVAAKTAITYGMDILLAIFDICGGILANIAEGFGAMTSAVTLPAEIQTAIRALGFFESIPLLLVALLGGIFVTVLSLVMILTVYARFFRLYLYAAISPVALATFGGDTTASTGKAFIKGYTGVCMEGAIIVLSCVIYNAVISSGALALGGAAPDAITKVFAYLAETILSMLILVGLVKGSDRIAKEMLALG